jgi:hypothetical protein
MAPNVTSSPWEKLVGRWCRRSATVPRRQRDDPVEVEAFEDQLGHPISFDSQQNGGYATGASRKITLRTLPANTWTVSVCWSADQPVPRATCPG